MYLIRPQDGVQGLDNLLSISEVVSKRTTDKNNRRQVPDRFSQARTTAEPRWLNTISRKKEHKTGGNTELKLHCVRTVSPKHPHITKRNNFLKDGLLQSGSRQNFR